MARKKATSDEVDLDVLFKQLAAESGGDTLDQLDSIKFFIDTGNLSINYSCSGRFIPGGICGGRIIEAFGPEASGKSLIGSNVLYGCQFMGGWPVLLDCENASNGEFMAKVSHLNLKRVLRYTPSSLEQAFRRIHTTTKLIRDREKTLKLERKPIIFMFDSLTVPPCERELRENSLPMDYKPTDWKKLVGRQEQPGERAKIISSEMRKLQSMVVKEDVTVYLINQIRDKIGVLYGSPETTPGGNAVKFYASLRFRTSAKKKIEHKTLVKFSGINMQVRNIKNRTTSPFKVSDDVKLFFEQGIDPISGLLSALIDAERIVMKSAGNFIVKEQYLSEGTTEYKFKASKTENKINVQVILDCPKLVDVETKEEVQTYLDKWNWSVFSDADYSERSLSFDSDGNPIEGEVADDGEYDYPDEPEEGEELA